MRAPPTEFDTGHEPPPVVASMDTLPPETSPETPEGELHSRQPAPEVRGGQGRTPVAAAHSSPARAPLDLGPDPSRPADLHAERLESPALARARTPDRSRIYLLLSLLSGIPGLIYQVVWTREVALVVGSSVQAISTVVAAFFLGLALGSRYIGARTDRAASPLRVYGWLEILAGAAAMLTPLLLRWTAREFAAAPALVRLLIPSLIILLVTFLLGGTTPALLRSAVRDSRQAARGAGQLVGLNTVGAFVGAIAAALMIPALGLQTSAILAGSLAISTGAAAVVLARRTGFHAPAPEGEARERGAPTREPVRMHAWALGVACAAGVATIGFEVVASRAAALRLGSSLLAWVAILGIFLVGLGVGNLCTAARASRTRRPELELGLIELIAALWLVASVSQLVPAIASRGFSSSVSLRALLRVCLTCGPPVLLMGAAFPYFVRLSVRSTSQLGAAFGTVAALNTAGGIVGSILAAFWLLPLLGPGGAVLAFASLNALIGAYLLMRSAPRTGVALTRVALGAAAFALATLPLFQRESRSEQAHLLFVRHGSQASAAVVHAHGERELYLDGELEAATGGIPRIVAELLAAMPSAIRPEARSLLEVGLGSGLVIGTSTLLAYERLDCVELADSVVRAARFFAPDNHGIGSPDCDERVTLIRADARAFLLTKTAEYDVIVADTVRPWSVGATGLYSVEYFERMRDALTEDGVCLQWLPLTNLGGEKLALILRTYYSVFPHGEVWWGFHNLMIIGSRHDSLGAGDVRYPPPGSQAARLFERCGIPNQEQLRARHLAGREVVLATVGAGSILSDDRPLLEGGLSLGPPSNGSEELALVERIARAARAGDAQESGLYCWIRSLQARTQGDTTLEEEFAERAQQLGCALPEQEALRHLFELAADQLERGELDAVAATLEQGLTRAPEHFELRLVQAQLRRARGELEPALALARPLASEDPTHARAQLLLGRLLLELRHDVEADAALTRALELDPFNPDSLLLAATAAARAKDLERARLYARRLRSCSPLGLRQDEQNALARLGL